MKLSFLAPLAVALVAAGCSTPRNVAFPDPRPLGDAYEPYVPPVSPSGEAFPEDPAARAATSGALTLSEALAKTLLYNPDLQVFGWEVRAREARTLQAGLWPNPEIGGDIEEFGGTGGLAGTGVAEMGLGLNQLLPLGGDVGARRRVAARERDLAGWDYEAVRLDVFTRAAQTFAEVLAAQERLLLADNLLALAQRFAQTVADRAEAGRVSPLEAIRAGVVRSNAEIAREQAARDLTAARKRLGSLWGNPEPDFERASGDFDAIRPVPALQAVADLVGRNPDVARFATEMALRRADLRLAKARRIPDPVLSAGPSRFNELGETAFRAGLSIPLPLFDRNQGAIQEARYRIRQVEADAEAARVEVQRQLASAYEALAAAYDAATTLEAEVLPAATEAFEGTEEGYREGKFDLLTVLDAQRTLFEATNQYVDAAQTYHQARAEVERLIGTPLTSL